MHSTRIDAFFQRVEKELKDDLLPFWTEKVLDERYGGFIGRMRNDLTVEPDAPKGLILNARLLWTYSALYRFYREEAYLRLAERAYEYMNRYFLDPEHGGAFWMVSAEGKPADDKKKIYGQAFWIYALAEYAQAAGDPEATTRAFEIFHLIERHSHDDRGLGYWETCNRDWSLAEDLRLSDKDMNEKKSMNNHLHVLEAYTNLYRVAGGEAVEHRLRELIDVFLDRILDPTTAHFNHFFDENWAVKSGSYTFGHDIEGSWLLCEAAEVLCDAAVTTRVNAAALRLADTARREGLDGDGGLLYEGRGGAVIDANKEWWPQAEAVVGFLNACELSGNPAYSDAAEGVWNFIETHTIDKTHGEWFWRVSRDGVPDPNEPKVSEWKGPYHNVRACLETLKRLNNLRKESGK